VNSVTMPPAAVFLAFLLCTSCTLSFARDAELSCNMLGECGACNAAKGCVWCSDGFCTSAMSPLCSEFKQESCDPVALSRRGGATVHCTAIYDCDQCISSNCAPCEDSGTQLFMCSASNKCPVLTPKDPYGSADWWEQELSQTNFGVVSSCTTPAPVSPNSPTLQVILDNAFCNLKGHATFTIAPAAFQAFAIKLLKSVGITITAPEITVTGACCGSSCTGKRSSSALSSALSSPLSGPDTASALLRFADTSAADSQTIAAALIAQAPAGQVSVTADSVPLQATGQGVSSSSNNDVSLSKGALAGIIIGSVIGGLLLIALLVFLVSRYRGSSTMAFRAPQAAYRP